MQISRIRLSDKTSRLSLCTCFRHYPGAASGRIVSLSHPAVSAFAARSCGAVCVEKKAGRDPAQQARQRSFAVEERAITQILTIVLDQFESIEDRLIRSLPAAQFLDP